ncbi:MAG: hypothetical protein LBH93_08785, partial [Chitinispirillales bacterium]|nr:hypothetical protein [Chitinispirillales bacterium]
MKNLKNALAKPSEPASLPWAMWIWNGAITKPEIEKQLGAFISKGFGGVAVRPGRDMLPSYMSQEFLENFGLVLEIAQKNKIGVRLADDFSLVWGGTLDGITNDSKAMRAEYLVFEGEVLAAPGDLDFEIVIDPESEYMAQAMKKAGKHPNLSEVKQVPVPSGKSSFRWKAPSSDWCLLLYKKEPARGVSGCGVPNLLNPKVIQSYVQNVLEALKGGITKFVPATFEGIVTEMPALRPGGNAIFWDDDIAVKYKSKYKRDFLPMLPMLFMDIPGAERARIQAYSFIYSLMAERLPVVLDGWAKKYRLSQWVLWPETGMYRPEGALCDGYVPPEAAISALGLQNVDGSLENFALLRAAADVNTNQHRRETVTVIGRNRTGVGATLSDLKREIDLSLLSGPSRVIIDGLFFNADQRNAYKAPYNPSWYSPDWEHMKLLCDYSARAQEAVGGLHTSREIAVLHPSAAAMGDYMPGGAAAASNGMARFQKAVHALCCFGKGFDVVNEELLISCTVRQSGEFATADRIRKGNYQALVIPYAPLVSRSLLVFLEKLAIKGTTLVFIDEPPKGTLEDGSSANVASRIQKMAAPKRENVHVVPVEDLENALGNVKPEAMILRESGESADVGVQAYHGEGGRLYLLHNILDSAEQTVVADIQADKHYAAVDCASGKITEIEPIDVDKNTARLRLTLSPLQTMFIVSSAAKQAPLQPPPPEQFNPFTLPPRTYRIIFKEQWDFEPRSPSVLPLSNWSVRIGLSRESGQISHFYETSFEVRDIPPSSAFMLNGMSRSAAQFQGLELSINGFRIESEPSNGGESASEPESHLLKIFGEKARRFDISKKLIKGINRVSIRTTGAAIDPQTLVYPPIIAGNFSVAKGSHGLAIDKIAPLAGHDSWTKHGYPYLSGRGYYAQTF